jgi:hypothetical protein
MKSSGQFLEENQARYQNWHGPQGHTAQAKFGPVGGPSDRPGLRLLGFGEAGEGGWMGFGWAIGFILSAYHLAPLPSASPIQLLCWLRRCWLLRRRWILNSPYCFSTRLAPLALNHSCSSTAPSPPLNGLAWPSSPRTQAHDLC